MGPQFTSEELDEMRRLLPDLEEVVAQVACDEIRPEAAQELFESGEKYFREILRTKLAAAPGGRRQRQLELLTNKSLGCASGEKMLRAMVSFFDEATGKPNKMLVREELDIYRGW